MEPRRKTKRAVLSDETRATLTKYHERGMDNYNRRDERAIELLGEAEKETGLDKDTIKRWIDNKKRKLADKGGEEHKRQLSVSTGSRKKSGYDLFRSDFLKTNGDDSKMSDKMASAAALWNDMGEAEKTSYKHRAAAEKRVEIEDLDEEGKDVVARSLRKKIDELFQKLQRCGYESAVMEFKNSKKTPYVYGSAKGGDFLELRPDIQWEFAAFCSGVSAADIRDPNKQLRQNVCKKLNTKIYEASKGKWTQVPYKKIEQGLVEVSGLPEGFRLRRPALCTKSELELLLEIHDKISFRILQPISAPQTSTQNENEEQARMEEVDGPLMTEQEAQEQPASINLLSCMVPLDDCMMT